MERVHLARMPSKRSGAPVILFTGFPGFIGLRLLPRLLELQPEATFECLVQDRFLVAARAAIDEMEARHPPVQGRIGTVVGDIAVAGLGIRQEAASELRRDLVSAYHLAAVYDLAVKREVGMRINVEGTRNVLEFLSGAPRFERLHYVSTAYVSGTAVGTFRESDLDVGQSFKNHYEETKFLAEVEVVKSGIAATTYRPGIVVGDSRTGETGKFDGPYFVLTAMERVFSPGAFVRVGSGRNPVNLVPVDFVVEALASLSSRAEPRAKTYHLTDPHPISAQEIAELFARCLGKSFIYVPVPRLLAKRFFAPRPVQRFFGMPAEHLDYFDHPCRYDATEATRDLMAMGIVCPSFPDYVDKLVQFYCARKGTVRREAMI
jgi:thioester reductase-like protein